MGSEFTFYDYLDDNEQNVIASWLSNEREVSKKARVKFTKGLLNLEATPIPWPIGTFFKMLDQQCAGLFELRVPLDKQYRILGFHLGRTPTLVHCFVKRGGRVPVIHCAKANERKAQVLAEPVKRRTEHKHGKQ